MQNISLPSGGRLLYERTDKFKSEFLTVNFFVPLTRESATAYHLLTDVLCRGSADYPTQQLLNKRCDELYSIGVSAGTSKCGEMLCVTFSISAISNDFAFDGTDVLCEGLKLLSGLMSRPYLENGHFPEEYISQEKRNLRDYIRSLITNKSAYASWRLLANMCEGEPAAVYSAGCEELIDGITNDTLLECLRVLNDEVAPVITYVGNTPLKRLQTLLSQSLSLKGTSLNIEKPTMPEAPAEMRYVSEKMNINQCKLLIGFRMKKTLYDSDYVKFALFNELLGASPTSRLFVNIREKKSLCYYCQSAPFAVKGIFIVASGIESKNKKALTDAVFEQIADIASGNISPRELEEARKSLIGAYREICDGASAINSWYVNRFFAGRSDSPEDAAAAAERVTASDIAEMAKMIVPDTHFVLEGTEAE